jgi:probable HAF family extracellular repeat protein
MKRPTTSLPALLAAMALGLTACGSGGGGRSNPDRDGDGIPNIDDAFPDDPNRFASFATVLLARLANGMFGAAVAVNGDNQVVGVSDDGTGAIKAVKWTVSGTTASDPAQLNPIAGNDYSAAYGLSDDGVAVGESQKLDGLVENIVAVVWPAGASDPTELSLDGFAPPAAAYGIRGGRIVGEVTSAGQTVAVTWNSTAATPVLLGTLGGDTSSAYFIGNGGRIVGESVTAAGASRGALWVLDAGGNPTAPVALEPLPGHVASIALSVNDAGQIVGESESASGEVHAVTWTADAPASPVDLGAGSAGGINESDRIAGYLGTPTQPRVWDSRNTSVADAVLTGTFDFAQAYGLNDLNVIVGLADDRGFVAIPQ